VRPLAAGLRQSGRDTGLLLQQTDIRLVAGAWLDFWGILWNVPRLAGESDPDYRRRFLYELTLPRTTAGGIARLIELSEGYRGTVVDAPTAGHFEVTLEVPTDVDVESEFDRISVLIDRYKAVGTTYTLYMRGLVVLSLPAEGIQASYLDFPDQYTRRDAIAGNAMRDYIAIIYEIQQESGGTTQSWNYLTVINRHTGAAQHAPIGEAWSGADNPRWRLEDKSLTAGMAYYPPSRQIMIGNGGIWHVDPLEQHPRSYDRGVATYVPSTHELWSGESQAIEIRSYQDDSTVLLSLEDVYPDLPDPYILNLLYVPSIDRVYVTDIYAPRILIIDPGTRTVESIIAAGSISNHVFAPQPSMTYDPHRDRVFVIRYVAQDWFYRHPGHTDFYRNNRNIGHTNFNAYEGAEVVTIDLQTGAIDLESGILEIPLYTGRDNRPPYQHLVYVPTTGHVYISTGPVGGWPPLVTRINPETLAVEDSLFSLYVYHLTWHQAAQRMYAIDPTQTDALHILALDDLTIDTANSITAALPSLPGSVRLIRPFALLTDYHAGLQYDLGRATLED
jgi:hypothetical protein